MYKWRRFDINIYLPINSIVNTNTNTIFTTEICNKIWPNGSKVLGYVLNSSAILFNFKSKFTFCLFVLWEVKGVEDRALFSYFGNCCVFFLFNMMSFSNSSVHDIWVPTYIMCHWDSVLINFESWVSTSQW